MPNATFIDPAAVEAWDAWFRLRDGTRLRDTTIGRTWQRVADAIGGDARLRDDLFAAMTSWRILLDERILAQAGTPAPYWPADPGAVVNAAVFVRDAGLPGAHFDTERFAESVALALRVLDAALSHSAVSFMAPQPSVGVIGVADALALLDVRYASAMALALARDIGRALAEGCLEANVALARDHGMRVALTAALRARVCGRGAPAGLVADAERHGLRHANPLVLTPRPRLALFANNVADGLDPLAADDLVLRFPPDGRSVRSRGYARTRAQAAGWKVPESEALARVPIDAQLALRGAMQAWFDRPIEHPVRVAQAPSATDQERARAQAVLLGLGEFRWATERTSAAEAPATPA